MGTDTEQKIHFVIKKKIVRKHYLNIHITKLVVKTCSDLLAM